MREEYGSGVGMAAGEHASRPAGEDGMASLLKDVLRLAFGPAGGGPGASRVASRVATRVESRRRKLARQVFIYMCHVTLGLSQRAVGILFGRHRTSVRYVCARIEDRRDDPAFDRKLRALECAILTFAAEFHVAGSGASFAGRNQ